MLPMKVLVVDDHRLFRQGLISLMGTRPDLVEVVGQAEAGCEALQLTGQLRPDLILMDIYMPGEDGLTTTKKIRRQYPDVKIVMLTASEEDAHVHDAVKSGVVGYLIKNLDADELFDLIEGVERGEAAMTRTMAARLLKKVAEVSVDESKGEEALTERELEVIRLLARGVSNPRIAQELNISINTVKTHISHILAKLQLENRTQAAAYAVEKRMVVD